VLFLAVPLGAMVAAVVLLLLVSFSGQGQQPASKKAAIIDQLGLTSPNPSFVEATTSMLEGAGYTVDYYPGEEVTVGLYRDLPSRGYGLIVLRVHSALLGQDLVNSAEVSPGTLERALTALQDNVFLFTSEPYSETGYLEEQKALRVVPARYYSGDGPRHSRYFAVSSDFVSSSMKGEFHRTLVVLMGCDGLTFDRTAAAFVEKGARGVVGWNGPVSASHTDAATGRLLERLVVDRYTIGEAVTEVMAELGPDPSYGSNLIVYPAEAAGDVGP